MATPQSAGNTNSIYLRIIIGLLSVSGTLFSFIGVGILNSLDDLKKKVEVNSTAVAVHEAQIKQNTSDIASLQGDVKTLLTSPQMYALKPDEVGRRKRIIAAAQN